MEREPHAVRAQINIQRAMLGVMVCEVSAAKNRGGRRVRDRRRVNVAEAVGASGWAQVVEPTVSTNVCTVRARGAKIAEPPRGERREPRIETEGARVEHPTSRAIEHAHG